MIAHALSERPLECCGLLAGVVEKATDSESDSVPLARALRRYPLVNALASEREFESDAQGMFDAMRDISTNEYDLLGIYHSHPTSTPIPSKTDLARSYYPDVVNFIVSLATDPPTIRGWWLHDDRYEEAVWSEV